MKLDPTYDVNDKRNYLPLPDWNRLKQDGIDRGSTMIRLSEDRWRDVVDEGYLIGRYRINKWGVFEAQTMLGREMFCDMEGVMTFIFHGRS